MSKTKRRKKKNTVGRLVVLLILLLILAALLALEIFSSDSLFKKSEPYVEYLESGVVIRPLQSPEPGMEDPFQEDEEPVETPLPTDTPAPQLAPEPEPEGAVILEDRGELEIIIPDSMDTDGF